MARGKQANRSSCSRRLPIHNTPARPDETRNNSTRNLPQIETPSQPSRSVPLTSNTTPPALLTATPISSASTPTPSTSSTATPSTSSTPTTSSSDSSPHATGSAVSTPTSSNAIPSQDISFGSFVEEQRNFNTRVLQLLQDNVQRTQENTSKGRLPLKLTEAVRNVYRDMLEASERGDDVQLWNFEESFISASNAHVNDAIKNGVRSTAKEKYSSAQIRAALRCHFKTKRRKNNMLKNNTDKVYLKSQRSRSRLNTKRQQRLKVLQESTSLSEEIKRKYGQLLKTNEFVSSEESMSEESDEENSSDDDSDSENIPRPRRGKVLLKKPLNWRSGEVSQFMKRLDRRIDRKKSNKQLQSNEGKVELRRQDWHQKMPQNGP